MTSKQQSTTRNIFSISYSNHWDYRLVPEKIPDASLLPGFHILLGLFLCSLDFLSFELRVAGSNYFATWLSGRQLAKLTIAHLAFAIFGAMLQEAAIIVVVGVVIQSGPI